MTNHQEKLLKLYNELIEEIEKNPEAKEEFFKNNKLFIGGCVFYNQDGFIKMFQKGSIVCNQKIDYNKQLVVVNFDENELELEGLSYEQYLKDNFKVGYNDTFNIGDTGGHLSIHPTLRQRQIEAAKTSSFQSQMNQLFINVYSK